ncbi:dTDP-L-rhamnose 4-epimerase [Nakamurella sp. UYEF19]|uniref:NAD-dependent epimerase/dehydratase family protein n=1 Tax=Nakamurella sp. UYEF19 TaxID=1756392 RepID=UPI00339A739D
MRVLLTGAAGFIGSTIADQLLARGDEIVPVDLLLPAAHGSHPPQWSPGGLIIGDVRDAEFVRSVLPGVDVVCHQAAMVGLGVDAADAPEYAGHNVLGTAVLLAEMAAAGVRSLVQASSMVVYGEGRYRCAEHGDVRPGPRLPEALTAGAFDPPCPQCGAELRWTTISEDAPLDPRNTYAASKLAQEHFAASWARQTSSGVTSLRYHNVYGPRMPRDTPYAGVAAIFRSALESGRAPRVYEDGGQMRDFIHVSDIAAANLAALDRIYADEPVSGGEALACNVSSGHPHTVGEMATVLAAAMGGPAPEVVGGGRAGDVRHVVADPALARQVLGFTAQVDFATGVREFATAPMRPPAT